MNEKVISKIQKLLNLANNNPSQEEAQSAMLMAQELMAKNNITMENLPDSEKAQKEVGQEWVDGGQSCGWKRQLARIICDNFKCSFLISKSGLVFIGLKEDLEICIPVYNYAISLVDTQMRKLRRTYRKQGLSTDGISGDYAMGFILGIKQKFKEQVEKNNWGLILVKDQLVTDTVAKLSKGAAGKGTSLNTSGNNEIFSKGFEAGKSFTGPGKLIK